MINEEDYKRVLNEHGIELIPHGCGKRKGVAGPEFPRIRKREQPAQDHLQPLADAHQPGDCRLPEEGDPVRQRRE